MVTSKDKTDEVTMTEKKREFIFDVDRLKRESVDSPGLIHFPHMRSGVVVAPEDQGKIKSLAISAMQEQTEMQMAQLYQQAKLLADQAQAIFQRVQISERLYQAEMGFDPLVGRIYYLYQRKSGADILSLVAPEEWGTTIPFKRFIAKVKLLSDHTWEVLEGEIL
jgi:hypothetical protein